MNKVIVLVLIGILAFSGISLASNLVADPPSGTTEGTNWTTPSTAANDFLNKYASHEHGIPARENPLGVGLDIEYLFSDTYATAVEYKYDFANEEHSTYLVGKITFGRK